MQIKNISARHPVTLGRFMILVSILLLNVWTPPAPTQAANTDPVSIFLPIVNKGVLPPPPTAQQLIQEDLAAGRIDANTALLYRAYALYGDPRLPGQYSGGFLVEDPVFFNLAQDPNLPADLKAQLEPFLARPDDPVSIYNANFNENALITAPGSTDLFCDTENWTALASLQANVQIKVHARCTGAYEVDINTALQSIEALWEPMTDLMGQPIPDLGGAIAGYSTDIDIYLLTPLDELKRYPGSGSPLSAALGVAPVAPPFQGSKSSGYIIVDRAEVNNGASFQQILAHEFFHVLQHAHNYEVHFNGDTEWWFTEASATWAEAHFVPSNSADTHTRFTYYFQQMSESLHATGQPGTPLNYHMYAAYIWPFFMEQEKSAQSIARVWRELEIVGSNWIAAMLVLDMELPFSQGFRRFALRNLNVALQPGDPIQPRYIGLDPQFPDQRLPGKLDWSTFDLRNVAAMPRGTPISLGVQVPALDAEYYHFSFDPEVLRVELDLSTVAALNGVAVEAVVKGRSKPWEHRSLTGQTTVKLCDIEELYLIFSNERLDINAPAAVSFTLSPLAELCTCQQAANIASWDGEITVSYFIEAKNSDWEIFDTRSASISGHLTETYRNPSAVGFMAAAPGGNGKTHFRKVRLYPTGNYLDDELLGDGPPLPYDPQTLTGSRIMLSFNLQECIYTLYVSVWITGTSASENHPPSPVNIGIVQAGSAEYAIPDGSLLNIIGTGSWPAHSSDYVESQWINIDYITQDDYDIQTILGEHYLGAAQVSWSFTPSAGP